MYCGCIQVIVKLERRPQPFHTTEFETPAVRQFFTPDRIVDRVPIICTKLNGSRNRINLKIIIGQKTDIACAYKIFSYKSTVGKHQVGWRNNVRIKNWNTSLPQRKRQSPDGFKRTVQIQHFKVTVIAELYLSTVGKERGQVTAYAHPGISDGEPGTSGFRGILKFIFHRSINLKSGITNGICFLCRCQQGKHHKNSNE